MQGTEPRARRWTKAEYSRMGELGWFRDQRVELIEGEIVVQSPQDFPHSKCTDRVHDALKAAFGARAWVRMQLPVDFGPYSEPEPDVSVVPGNRDEYQSHPEKALLIVEVASSSLSYDRGKKASLYARVGVADYWVVNLVDHQLEIFRDPVPEPTQPYGFGYRSVDVLEKGDSVTPLALKQITVPVADLLP